MSRALFTVEGIQHLVTDRVLLQKSTARNAWAFLTDTHPGSSDELIGLRPGFEYRYFRQHPITADCETSIPVAMLKWVEFYPSYDPIGTVLRIQDFEEELWSIQITTRVSEQSRLRDTFCNEAFGFSGR